MFFLKKVILITLLLVARSNARPWEVQDHDAKYTGPFVQPLLQGLDAWIASALSQPPVPLVGAGAALAYLGYAGTLLLTSDEKSVARSPRSAETSSDLLDELAPVLFKEALGNTESATAFRKAGARSLQHGATVLRRALDVFSRGLGTLYSTLSNSRRALSSDCVSERLCRIGQVTGMQWPLIGVLLRSLDSADLDEYSRALIDGTTVGDCRAIYPKCPE